MGKNFTYNCTYSQTNNSTIIDIKTYIQNDTTVELDYSKTFSDEIKYGVANMVNLRINYDV